MIKCILIIDIYVHRAKLETPLAGHTTSSLDFHKNYLNKLLHNEGQNVVAFLQDKVSYEMQSILFIVILSL